jgi:hypothetical protein
MKRLYSTLAIIVVVAMCLLCSIGCKENMTGNPQVGNISGVVILFDTTQNEMASNGGVSVEIEGTNYRAVSDSTGFWILHNVPASTYSLKFSKEGFATVKNMSVSLVGGGTVWTGLLGMGRLIQFAAILDSLIVVYTGTTGDTLGYLGVSGRFTSSLSTSYSYQYVYIMLSASPNPDCNDPSTYLDSFFGEIETNNSKFTYYFMASVLNVLPKNQKIYVSAVPIGGNGSYTNVNNGRTYYANLGVRSNPLSFVMP